MRLHSICYYRSKSDAWTEKWSGIDYAARNLIKAIKHDDFKGYSEVNSPLGKIRIDNSFAGRAKALEAVAATIANKVVLAGYQNASIIPIPSSSHTNPLQMFTGRRIAEAVQRKNSNLIAAPVLYFNEPLPKSAGGGGTRNADAIQAHLRMSNCHLTGNVVLIDDVSTTGGHLKAAARFLRQYGLQVEDAFVVGRTAWEKPDNMFDVKIEEINTSSFFDLDF